MTAEKTNVQTGKSMVTKVSVLVLAILFKSSTGTGIGNTFCQSIVTGTDNSFHKYSRHPCEYNNNAIGHHFCHCRLRNLLIRDISC